MLPVHRLNLTHPKCSCLEGMAALSERLVVHGNNRKGPPTSCILLPSPKWLVASERPPPFSSPLWWFNNPTLSPKSKYAQQSVEQETQHASCVTVKADIFSYVHLLTCRLVSLDLSLLRLLCPSRSEVVSRLSRRTRRCPIPRITGWEHPKAWPYSEWQLGKSGYRCTGRMLHFKEGTVRIPPFLCVCVCVRNKGHWVEPSFVTDGQGWCHSIYLSACLSVCLSVGHFSRCFSCKFCQPNFK